MIDQSLPTVFHLTHWKAGSQWVLAVLSDCVKERIVKPKVQVAQFYDDPIIPGAVYPTVYVSRPRFEKTIYPSVDKDPNSYSPLQSDTAEVQNWYNFKVRDLPIKKFLVIRDLRDAMVSLYFSLKVSHPIISERVAEGRRALNEMDFEDGFIHLLNTRGKANAEIQQSWLADCKRGEVLLFHYEEMIMDEQREFSRMMEYCQIDISPRMLSKIVTKNSFSNLSGRKPGVEDISSHYRKGISGDWKNHLTERLKLEFKERFGQLLIDTGYEKDLNW